MALRLAEFPRPHHYTRIFCSQIANKCRPGPGLAQPVLKYRLMVRWEDQ